MSSNGKWLFDVNHSSLTSGSWMPNNENSFEMLLDNNSSGDPFESGGNWTCLIYDFVIETVIMGMLCLFGFVGNILSILCLHRDTSKTATPFLLISLDIADTVFLVTVVILRVFHSAVYFAGWIDYEWVNLVMAPLVKFFYPVALMAMTSTVYLTLLVTLNRYVSVCKPYDVRTLCSPVSARIHVILVVAFSVIYNLPRFFEYDIGKYAQPLEDDNTTVVIIQTLVPSNFSQNRYYTSLLNQSLLLI